MITIFCDFWQISAKKLAFFSKNNVMIKFLYNLALFWVKNANFFAKFFVENILKIITLVPGHPVWIRHLDQGQGETPRIRTAFRRCNRNRGKSFRVEDLCGNFFVGFAEIFSSVSMFHRFERIFLSVLRKILLVSMFHRFERNFFCWFCGNFFVGFNVSPTSNLYIPTSHYSHVYLICINIHT
jgi:hypothetical protein